MICVVLFQLMMKQQPQDIFEVRTFFYNLADLCEIRDLRSFFPADKAGSVCPPTPLKK